MDINAAILEEHSKTQTEIIAIFIGNDQSCFNELMRFALDDTGADATLANRAAWVILECTDRYPKLILPHLET